MRCDWDKDSGKWQVFEDDSEKRVALVDEVQLLVPSVLVTVDGGRHGFLTADGVVTIENNIATIRRKRDG